MKNLHFETILKDAENFILTENDSYIQTYPEFLKYFEKINTGNINEHNLVIASHFVYGWMPTIIHLDLKQKGEILKLLNAVKSGHLLDVNDLETLKKAINNSLVGLSKLLHFINPRDYAIWDSRIFRYLTEKKSSYGIDRPRLYLDYLNGIREISENKDYGKIHHLISRNFDYDVYPTRVIEIIMFETDRNRHNQMRKITSG